MSVNNLIKIKNSLIIFASIFILIGSLFIRDESTNEVGLTGSVVFDVIFATLFAAFHTILWSQWFYHNYILSDGDMEESYFFKLGISAIIITSFFPLGAIYNTIYDGNLNSIYVIPLILIIFVILRKL